MLNSDDMVVQSFLWALGQSDEIKEHVISCYRRLSAHGNVMSQHKLSVLTGKLRKVCSLKILL